MYGVCAVKVSPRKLHKNVICSYEGSAARRGATWTEIDSHRWIRAVKKLFKKKEEKKKEEKKHENYESQSSRMSSILAGFHLERARACVDDRNLSINR